MSKLTKKALPMLLIGGMLAGTAGFTTNNVHADTLNQTQSVSHQQEMEQVKNFKPSQEAMDFMSKVVKSGAIKEFDYTSDLKIMSYKHDMNTIKNTYNFTDNEITKLEQIVETYNESQKNNTIFSTNSITTDDINRIINAPQNVDVDYGWTWIELKFSNEEMKLFLIEAAIAGPYALYGALVGLSSITSTPVGGAIVGALGLMGMPKFASICQTIIRAHSADKGVKLEVGLDGVIPYITASVARH
ncbi:hypothetical protein [Bacillus sp. FSL K6-0067]|uniref:hypothetical protein n=1 Tax=Bacillus sp. FSL K6-0067 TaxID=2921412 RepID=UPI00077A8A0C|nr:hypothetical protein [Bacillus cereus]KXY35584.1 hypothetical protein AT267_02795 [Bacillus cereus]